MLADVLGVEVVTVNTEEGAAYGAALLAAAGAGAFASVEAACAAAIKITGVTRPGPDCAVYERQYPGYQDLYPALKKNFQKVDSV